MPYKYRFDFPKHIVLRRHKRRVRLLFLLLILFISGILIFIWYITRESKASQPQTDLKSASYDPLQTFETPYFSFEVDRSWSFVQQESSSNVFVYRSSKNNIVSRDFTVYVNTLPRNLLLTHVLPLEPDGNRFVMQGVSEHCKDYIKDKIQPGNNNPIEAIIESVNIKCQIDGTSNTAGSGQVNGSYKTKLGDNDFYLLYHDLEFSPRFTIFTNIVQSFRAK